MGNVLLPTLSAYDTTPGGPNNRYKGVGMAKHQLRTALSPVSGEY
jgi:hypothetical protein